jgi:TIR domain
MYIEQEDYGRKKPDVFISFSRGEAGDILINKNLSFPQKLCEHLRKQNLIPWMDEQEDGLNIGPYVQERVFKSILESTCFLFVLTDDSILPNSYARREYAEARRLEKPIYFVFHDRSKEAGLFHSK